MNDYDSFVSVRLSPGELNDIDQIAADYGSTRSVVIRAFIKRTIDEINGMEGVRKEGICPHEESETE